jgi:hypothetical protein
LARRNESRDLEARVVSRLIGSVRGGRSAINMS